MTRDLFNAATEIDEAISGAYQLLRESNGYTGGFNLKSAGFATYLNTEGLGINGILGLTGSQIIEGELTGNSFNHLANLVVTGDAYIANITGITSTNDLNATGETDITQLVNGINTSGDAIFNDHIYGLGDIRHTGDLFTDGVFNLNGSANVTGDLSVTGNFTLNGSGISDFIAEIDVDSNIATGDVFSAFSAGIGQLIIGTGEGTGVILETGNAESGYKLTYNPNSEKGLEWQAETGRANGITLFREYDSGSNMVGLEPENPIDGIILGQEQSNKKRKLRFNANSIGATTADILDGTISIGPGAVNLQCGTYSRSGALPRGMFSTIAGGADSYSDEKSRYTFIGGGFENEIRFSTGSSILGGWNNQIEEASSQSSIIGGSGNFISDCKGTVVGGLEVGITGSDNSVAIGRLHSINNASYSIGLGNLINLSGVGSVGIGYECNTASEGDYATSIGLQSFADKWGEVSHSAGRFADDGDAKSSRLVSRNSTSNDTQTELFLNGSTARIEIPTDSSATFVINIVGQEEASGGGDAGAYEIKGLIKNISGTTSLVGAITKTTIAEDDATWDVTAEADNGNDALVIKVTGAAATNIRWVATTKLTQVTYA